MNENGDAISAKLNSNPTRPGARKRRTTFRLLAVLLGFAPFVLLETGLQLADVARPTQIDDPFVGFSDIHPLFALDADEQRYRTVISRQLSFAEESFSAKKLPNGFRVFCLGGSTVHGRPYQHHTSFSAWMQLELAAIHPDRRIEVVNCGGISYASYRLLPILREVLDYQPDLIVVATGHNEFLEDRTYQAIKTRSALTRFFSDIVYSSRTLTLLRQLGGSNARSNAALPEGPEVLPEEVETRLDTKSGYASYHYDAQWRTDVVRHFESSIRSMIHRCRDRDVPVVLVQLGSNLRDCPPFKSEHPPEFSDEDKRRWQSIFEKAKAAEIDDLEGALKLYHDAEAIQPKHSLLAYRIARCCDLLDRHEQARDFYIKARQWDVCPLRVLDESLQSILKAVPDDIPDSQKLVSVVDAQELIGRDSDVRIPGFESYIDHVHPTIASHQKISRTLIARIQEMQVLPAPKPLTARDRQRIYQSHFDELGPIYLSNGGRRVHWLEKWARRQRLINESNPRDSLGFERLGHRFLDLGDHESALKQYATAMGLDTESSQRLMVHADKLWAQGRAGTASQLRDWLQR